MNFAIRPVPYEDESPIGYVLRLAKRNGLSRINHLLNKQELMRVIKGLPSKQFELDKLTPKAQPLTKLATLLWENSRLLTVQVCPLCICEQGYLKEIWQNPFKRHCEEHRCLLSSRCTRCGQPFNFDMPLLAGRCSNPKCSSKIQVEREHDVLLSESVVADCYLAALLRKAYPLVQSKYPPVDVTFDELADAAELLTNPTIVSEWLKEIVNLQSMHLPLNFALKRVSTLSSRLKKNWPSHSLLNHANEVEYKRNQAEILPLWLSHSDTIKLLGVANETLETLKKNNLITSKSGNTINHRSIIDVSPVIQLLHDKSVISSMAPLSSQKETLLFNDVCISELLVAIKHGNLNVGYSPAYNLLDSIYINPNTLTDFATKTFKQKKERSISIEKAMQITGASLDELMKLRKQGKFRSPAWSYLDTHVVYEDVLEVRFDKLQQLELQLE